ADVPAGCQITRTFTITASDVCGNVSAPQTVVYTWTNDTTAPVLANVPVGSDLGCNPASGILPTDASVQGVVTATETCSTATVTVTHADVPAGCQITRTFTITASDVCGNVSAPQTMVDACSDEGAAEPTETCSTATVTVTHADVPAGCQITRTFTITASDVCGNVSAPQT